VVLTALRGAVGFLSRLPVGHSESAWQSFCRTPTVVPAVGYLLGALVALPLLLPLPEATTAILFVAGIYALTGITHVDGVADLGDALVVHGDADDRRAVLKDTTVGTGALLAVALVVAGLVLAGLALAGLPLRVAVAVVVTAEVGAKAALAGLVCVGDAAHEGLGSALTTNARPREALVVALVAAPALLFTWPHLQVGVTVLLAAVGVTLLTFRWATANLSGVSGDVLGATNELARVAGLHAGVVAWTLS
jgi:adenosylcobinamide-GDP ribazoletransferase